MEQEETEDPTTAIFEFEDCNALRRHTMILRTAPSCITLSYMDQMYYLELEGDYEIQQEGDHGVLVYSNMRVVDVRPDLGEAANESAKKCRESGQLVFSVKKGEYWIKRPMGYYSTASKEYVFEDDPFAYVYFDCANDERDKHPTSMFHILLEEQQGPPPEGVFVLNNTMKTFGMDDQ